MTTMNFDVHDLDWAAYCYTAGVLPAAEAERFEALLLESQTAREAVARAVELTESIAAAGPTAFDSPAPAVLEIVTPKTRAWGRVAGWVSLATAASLALVMFGRQPTEIASRGPIAPTATDVPALERLTAAWIASRSDADATAEDDSSAEASELVDDTSFEDDAAYESEFSAPSWLTAAVAGVSPESQGNQE